MTILLRAEGISPDLTRVLTINTSASRMYSMPVRILICLYQIRVTPRECASRMRLEPENTLKLPRRINTRLKRERNVGLFMNDEILLSIIAIIDVRRTY